jgi:DNA polymerase (family 10)
MVGNREIARTFLKIADILGIQGESQRRIRAYQRAAGTIAGLEVDIADIWREGKLEDLPGIGGVLATKIDEMLSTGKLAFYEQLVQEVPPGVVEMLKVPDIGPKTAGRMWRELGLTSIAELESAARAGTVQQLRGMGPRTEARILEGIASLRRWSGRTPLGVVWYPVYELLASLDGLQGVQKAAPIGALRRMQDMVSDAGLVVAARDPGLLVEHLATLSHVSELLAADGTTTTIRTSGGLDLSLHVVEAEWWGTALQYLTGSQGHNGALGMIAHQQGYRLSERALVREDGREVLCPDEELVYRHLGLPYIPPELREGRGEIEAAREGRLPPLIEYADLQGDLQMHTTFSDGHQSVAQMAEAARARGLHYILITDHSYGMAVAGGLREEELKEQRAEIDAVNARGDGARVLAGIEVEIRADGTLDYPDEVLAGLDIVVASLHTGLRTGRERTTRRLLSAIHNPHVDIIAHPTGRLLGKREGADLDIEAVLGAAAETGTALEINAHPDRLDLADVHVARAVELGVKLAINSDAHDVRDLDHLIFGLATARRGWATADHVVNAWSLEKLLAWARSRGA